MLGEGVDLFHISLPSTLVGKTLAEAGIGAHTGLNVIALMEDGRVEANPPASCTLRQGCTLIALGTPDQRHAFLDSYD